MNIFFIIHFYNNCSHHINNDNIFRSEVFSMDHYQEPGMSDNHYEQMPVIQQPQESQAMVTNKNTFPNVILSVHEKINLQEHQPPQTPVHDAMSNLQLENQIPSTSGGIVDSPGSGRITRARTRGMILINCLNNL